LRPTSYPSRYGDHSSGISPRMNPRMGRLCGLTGFFRSRRPAFSASSGVICPFRSLHA